MVELSSSLCKIDVIPSLFCILISFYVLLSLYKVLSNPLHPLDLVAKLLNKLVNLDACHAMLSEYSSMECSPLN